MKEAGFKAGVDLALVEERYQPPDHPIRLQFPEGRYLKFYVLAGGRAPWCAADSSSSARRSIPVGHVVLEGLWHRGRSSPPVLVLPPPPEAG